MHLIYVSVQYTLIIEDRDVICAMLFLYKYVTSMYII